MKTRMLILVVFLLNNFLFGSVLQETKAVDQAPSLSFFCTPDLQPVAEKWVKSFKDSNTASEVNIIAKVNTKSVLKSNQLYLLSDNELHPEWWKMVVGRAIVVPVISEDNQYYKEIRRRGVTKPELLQLLQSKQNQNWKYILGSEHNQSMQIYALRNELVENCLTSFFASNEAVGSIQFFESGNDLIQKLQENPNSVAFCLAADLDDSNGPVNDKIRLLPLDLNENGKLDQIENIYTNESAFYRGVWIGKYPRSLCHNIYLTSMNEPRNLASIQFARWIITEGQSLLSNTPYQALVQNEIPSKLSQLNEPHQIPVIEEPVPLVPRYMVYVGILFIVLIFLAELRIWGLRKRSMKGHGDIQVAKKIFNPSELEIPKGLLFDKTHTWAFMEKNGGVRTGIDEFITRNTGDFSRVILKSVGEKIRKGEPMLTIIQAGKQLEVYAPVTGTIEAFNDELISNISQINKDPFGEGWVYMINPDDWNGESSYLNMAGRYKDWITSEFSRLKDFIARAISGNSESEISVVLQDGGELIENVLSNLEPNIWEDFQNEFLDPS